MTGNEPRVLPSIADINERVLALEAYPDMASMLAESGDLAELQADAQYAVANAASDLMTGFRWKSEQDRFLEAYNVYKRLLGTVALQIADTTYMKTHDTGDAKRSVVEYLQESKLQMVTLDYEMRLRKSRFERVKQWLAHHSKTQILGSLAVSAATTSALFYGADHFLNDFSVSPKKAAGITGVAFVGFSTLVRSVTRTAPTKVGAALGKQLNASGKSYQLGAARRDGEDVVEDFPVRYARKHLTQPMGKVGLYMALHKTLDTDDDEPAFSDMVGGALDISEQSLIDSYEIRPKKFLRMMRFARTQRRIGGV